MIRPFYSVTDARGFSITADYRDETVNQYLDGIDEPVDTLDHVMGAIRTTAAWAVRREKRRYTRIGVLAQVVRDNYQPAADTAPIPQTVTAAVGGFMEWSRVRYIARTGFQTFSRTEDIDLSTTLTTGVYAAPAFFGYDSAGIGLFAALRLGAPFENGFILFTGISDGLITSAGVDSVRVLADRGLEPGLRT